MKIIKSIGLALLFPAALIFSIPVGLYEIYSIWSKDEYWRG